jgi:hypothetical protein
MDNLDNCCDSKTSQKFDGTTQHPHWLESVVL